MKTLYELLSDQDRRRPSVAGRNGSLLLDCLLDRAGKLRKDLVPGRTVAVAGGEDLPGFLATLIAYEGYVDTLLLQPAGTSIPPPPPARLLTGGQTRLLLATSGTTGAPKLIAHTLASLTATTKLSAAASELTWGLLYDPARFAGLQVVLQALLARTTLVAPDTADPEDAVECMIRHGVNALSATPSRWRKLLMTRSFERLALRQATLGGEIADAAILRAVRTRFPGARITHIYAATEVGVGFSVHDGDPGFPAAYLEEGALPGVRLKIDAGGHLLLMRTDPDRRPAGYGPGFADTGDLVELRGDRVHFLGRAGGLINVGGNKVSPEVVEAVLQSHPAVVAAKVFGKRSPVLGNVVAAQVQLRQTGQKAEIQAELRALCRTRLQRHQWPASLAVVEELAVTGSGKIERRSACNG